MDVVFISLEALIQKATNASLQQPDPAAIEAFCAVLSDAPDGPQLATRVIAARIQSQDAAESLLALTMLDKCMRKCNSHFHAEVGKFRFLNEMIKLVSPKYYANRTSPDVRQKVIQLLHAWQIEYPRESKFKVAYDMLKNQGVVKETPPPLPPEDGPVLPPARPASAVFDDEEKSKLLQKLLRSKNPDDLQAANRLIKTMVREEERRTEARCRRSVEVSAARASARLLAELLGHAAAASPDERQLMAELLAACRRHHPLVQQLAATTHHDERALEEILQASDELTDVFNKYDAVMMQGHQQVQEPSPEAVSNGPVHAESSLLDLAGPELPVSVPSYTPSAADTLGELFSSISMAEVPPLQPVSLIPALLADDVGAKGTQQADKGINSLDSLGEDLLKQSLPASLRMLDGFNNKNTKKIPMNALERAPSEPVVATLVDKNTILDLDFLLNKTSESLNTASPSKPAPPGANRGTQDDLMVDISMDLESLNPKCTESLRLNAAPSSHTDNDLLTDMGTSSPDTSDTYNPPVIAEAKTSPAKACEERPSTGSTSEVKPLTEIDVCLEDIVPSALPPMTVFEDESGRLAVVLHFGRDRPRPDVFVVVVSTTSKHAEPIEDYKFHAVVPKGCRVRLLPPSGSTLAAHKAFLPAPVITQVMLVGRPPAQPAPSLTLLLTYSRTGDQLTDMATVNSLPLDLL